MAPKSSQTKALLWPFDCKKIEKNHSDFYFILRRVDDLVIGRDKFESEICTYVNSLSFLSLTNFKDYTFTTTKSLTQYFLRLKK